MRDGAHIFGVDQRCIVWQVTAVLNIKGYFKWYSVIQIAFSIVLCTIWNLIVEFVKFQSKGSLF